MKKGKSNKLCKNGCPIPVVETGSYANRSIQFFRNTHTNPNVARSQIPPPDTDPCAAVATNSACDCIRYWKTARASSDTIQSPPKGMKWRLSLEKVRGIDARVIAARYCKFNKDWHCGHSICALFKLYTLLLCRYSNTHLIFLKLQLKSRLVVDFISHFNVMA